MKSSSIDLVKINIKLYVLQNQKETFMFGYQVLLTIVILTTSSGKYVKYVFILWIQHHHIFEIKCAAYEKNYIDSKNQCNERV